jgi:hypothetical protein
VRNRFWRHKGAPTLALFSLFVLWYPLGLTFSPKDATGATLYEAALTCKRDAHASVVNLKPYLASRLITKTGKRLHVAPSWDS